MNLVEEKLNQLLLLRPYKGESQPALIKNLTIEYLKRELLWAQSLECDDKRSFPMDFTEYLRPQQLPEEVKQRFNRSPFCQSSAERKLCFNYLRWEQLWSDAPELFMPYELPDLFAPILKIFEKGGGLSTEHGFLDLWDYSDGANPVAGYYINGIRKRILDGDL